MRWFTFLFGLLLSRLISAQHLTATVEVRVRWFMADLPIPWATVQAMNETSYASGSWQTGTNGKVSFQWPVGEELTLKLQPSLSYPEIQSATVIVPPEGLTGDYGEITFQVPNTFVYMAFRSALQMKYYSNGRNDSCHVVTTITPPDKNLHHCPHGVAGVQIELDPPQYDQVHYFGIIESGMFSCKTDIPTFFLQAGINFLYHLISSQFDGDNVAFREPIQQFEHVATTEDGGAMLLNVKARKELYTLRAIDPTRPDLKFTPIHFYCHAGGLVNASPPQSIKIIKTTWHREDGEESNHNNSQPDEYRCPGKILE